MTYYQSICDLWTSIDFYSRSKASFLCFVLLTESFHEIHAQHNIMVFGHQLNLYDNWTRLISCADGYIEMFL